MLRVISHHSRAGGRIETGLSLIRSRRMTTIAAGSTSEHQQEDLASKKLKMSKTIGTHSGTFHCDEALGCFLLQQTTPFAGADIVRTRDPEVLKGLDIIIDVGGVYDPETNRFDHHQKGFDEIFGHGFQTKLSSAGLVYKHYGRDIVASVMGEGVSKEDIESVYLHVYKTFMEAVDAIDNGVNQFDSAEPPKYVNNTHLSARVGHLNGDWFETLTEEDTMERFKAAMSLTGSEFMESLHHAIKSWLPARSYVMKDLQLRTEIDPSGQIMKLSEFVPWKSHIYDLEIEMKIECEVKYVVYNDDRDGSWRIQAVSVGPGSFNSRKALPEAWRGLRDDELSKVSGVPDCVFVHASGFIGGNKTYDGALQMAKLSLTM
jgi:uncharacterized UPF0160 family protein